MELTGIDRFVQITVSTVIRQHIPTSWFGQVSADLQCPPPERGSAVAKGTRAISSGRMIVAVPSFFSHFSAAVCRSTRKVLSCSTSGQSGRYRKGISNVRVAILWIATGVDSGFSFRSANSQAGQRMRLEVPPCRAFLLRTAILQSFASGAVPERSSLAVHQKNLVWTYCESRQSTLPKHQGSNCHPGLCDGLHRAQWRFRPHRLLVQYSDTPD